MKPQTYSSFAHLVSQTTTRFSNHQAFSFKSGFRTKTYTFSETFDIVQRFALFFKANHIITGDKVVVLSLNRPEYALLIFGALVNGVTLIPIDFRTNPETIKKFIQKTKPSAIFTTILFQILFNGTDVKQIILEELVDKLSQFAKTPLTHISKETLAAIMFTSGTTGEPKGTMITHQNLLSSMENTGSVISLQPKFRVLSILPLSHVLELIGGLLMAYSYGCHIHYVERINSITIVKALRRYNIQGMAVVPQMLRMILQNLERRLVEEQKQTQWIKAQKFAPYLPFKLRRLLFRPFHRQLGGAFELFACGSAPLELKLAKTWENLGIRVLEGYGASETTGIVSTNSLTDNKLGTCGKIVSGISYKQSETGELLVSGLSVVSGYFENIEKTKEAFSDGWFRTGDIVEIDRQGYLRVVGRDKFKIVLPDGKKVYPEDIENKLNNHPQVVDSAVFGLSADQEGELVHAEIITKSEGLINQIISDINQKLNSHEQILDYGVWKDEDFPRTRTLKVDRAAVKKMVIERNKNGVSVSSEKKESENLDKLIQILQLISGKKETITESMNLATDLKFDSLKRIELLALIEEELGKSIEELAITSATTVSDLRQLIKNGKPTVIDDGEKLTPWQFKKPTDQLRVLLQDYLAFPLFNIGIKLKIKNPENLAKIKTPQLFIFNHVGSYDVVQILRVLPKEIREKTAGAATAETWHTVWYFKYFTILFGNGFPFVKAESHKSMRGNFERVGELLDRGYNIIISPEGNISKDGKLLPFHTGAGYIAVEMGVPVTPFKLKGYFELWPALTERKLNLYWPVKRGTAEVVVGEPMSFSKSTSYEDATSELRQALLKLD